MVQENKKLKIIELVGSFTLAGAEIFAADLSKEFSKNGHDVKLISIFQSGNEKKYFERVGKEAKKISSTLVKEKFKPGLPALVQTLKARKKLENIIKEFHPNVIHTHTTYPDLLGKLIKKKYPNIKVVRTIHTTYDRFGKLRRLIMATEEKFLPVEDETVFISERIKRSFEKKLKCSNKEVIPIALDFSSFDKYKKMPQEECRRLLNLPEKGDIFLNIGRLIALKNQLVLVEAFAKAFKKDKNKYLLVIGDGPLKNSLKQKINELKMGSNIKLLGPRTDIPLLLRASNVFVLPSLWEGTPLTLLEAQYMNLKIIATDVGGIKDFIKNAKFISPSLHSIEKSLKEILKSDIYQHSMISSSIKQVFNHYIELFTKDSTV